MANPHSPSRSQPNNTYRFQILFQLSSVHFEHIALQSTSNNLRTSYLSLGNGTTFTRNTSDRSSAPLQIPRSSLSRGLKSRCCGTRTRTPKLDNGIWEDTQGRPIEENRVLSVKRAHSSELMVNVQIMSSLTTPNDQTPSLHSMLPVPLYAAMGSSVLFQSVRVKMLIPRGRRLADTTWYTGRS